MQSTVRITFENSLNHEIMYTRKKYSFAFIKLFSRIRTKLKRRNRVYVLYSKHTYRPMRARVVAQLSYNNTHSNIHMHLTFMSILT